MDTPMLPEWTGLFSHSTFNITSQSERYTEVRSRFWEPGFASAEAVSVLMPGVEVSQLLFESKEPLRITTGTTREEVQSVFILTGEATSDFYNLPGPVATGKNKHSFQYSPNFTGTHHIKTGKFEVLHFSFQIPFLKSLLQSAQDPLTDSICNRIERQESFPFAPEHLLMRPEMIEILRAVQQNRFAGLTRLLYLEAKTLELFSLQLDHLSKSACIPNCRISPQDREKLKAMRNYIEQNYLLPLSLASLSAEFNMNEFKLKKGYKALFGTTVFGHILTLRMGKAKQLLEEGLMNVSEVSDCIGYSNIPAFSAAFKKCFGYPPSLRLMAPTKEGLQSYQ